MVEKVIKLVDSEKDGHTERRKIRLLIDKKVRKQLVEKVLNWLTVRKMYKLIPPYHQHVPLLWH